MQNEKAPNIRSGLLKKPARPSYLLHLQKYKGKHSTWDPYLYLKKEQREFITTPL